MSRLIFVSDIIVSVFSTLSRLFTLGRDANGEDTSWLADACWLNETEGTEAIAMAHRFAIQAYSQRDRNGGRYWDRVAGELHRMRTRPGGLRKCRDDLASASSSARFGEARSMSAIPHISRADGSSFLKVGPASSSKNLQDESFFPASAPLGDLNGEQPSTDRPSGRAGTAPRKKGDDQSRQG